MEDIFTSLYTWYHIRLHIDHEPEIILGHFKKLSLPYLIARERNASRPHYQILLGYNNTLEHLRTYVKTTFDVRKQSMYSISAKRTTIQKLKTYLLKEGEYWYNGFSTDELDNLKKLCFKKAKDVDWYALDDQFLATDMTWEEYIEKFDDMKLSCRQTGNDQTMLRRLDMLMRRRDENYRKLRRSKMKRDFRNYFLDPN